MQHGVTASAGQRRGDLEIRNYVQGQAGRRSLVFDLSMTHDRFGSSSHVQQNGLLSHPRDLDAPLRLAAQRKTNSHVIVKSLIPKSKSGMVLGKGGVKIDIHCGLAVIHKFCTL